jgi:hypothetical protein
MYRHTRLLGPLILVCLSSVILSAKPVHHYVFFAMDREKIKEMKLFLDTPAFEGAQIAYSWRQLEPGKDEYDFSLIREDLAFLNAHGKKLWIQIQDVSFNASRVNVPKYLLSDAKYNGGADKQYNNNWDSDKENPKVAGWVARRWDPAVQERFHKLLFALAKEFDGRITGINLAETSTVFGPERLHPKGYTPEIYCDAIIANMKALKRAFTKSVALQYANFMPGEWQNSKGYLGAVYKAAQDAKIGVGGPDLLPYRAGQLSNSYPLLRDSAGIVPVGIAVQDGNYEDINPKTKKRVTISELIAFATDYLKVDYIFWCTQEPFFSSEVVPYLKNR